MADVRVQIPDPLLASLQDKLGAKAKATDITLDALALYNWAVEEKAKGRVLVTTDANGGTPTRLTMPSLESIKAA